MAKTTAERQSEYRKKRPLAGENGERRLNTYLSTSTSLALSRLAKRYGVTKREIMEKLINDADRKIVNELELDSEDWVKYFCVTQ